MANARNVSVTHERISNIGIKPIVSRWRVVNEYIGAICHINVLSLGVEGLGVDLSEVQIVNWKVDVAVQYVSIRI